MGFMDNTLLNGKYLTGHPLITRSIPIRFSIENDGVILKWGFKNQDKIPWDHIAKITAETQGSITKSLSMGKAAVGLVLLGPLGALLGAGIGKKVDNRVNYVSIIFTDDTDTEHNLVIESKNANYIVNRLVAERYKHLKDKMIANKE